MYQVKELTKPDLVLPGRYLITDQGIIIDKVTGMPRSFVISGNGYLDVRLIRKDTGKTYPFAVARLVALNFCENDDPENKTQVDHVNGEKKFNFASNLEWVTPLENTRRAIAIGLNNHTGENNPMSIFPVELVEQICQRLETGLSPAEVYRTYYDGPIRTDEERSLYRFIWLLKKRKVWPKVTAKYTYSTDVARPTHKYQHPTARLKFNEDDIRWICERLVEGDMKRQIAIDIVSGARRPSFEGFTYQQAYSLVSAIRRRASWSDISKEYEFLHTNSRAQIEKHEYYTEFEELTRQGKSRKEIIVEVAKKYEKHPTYIGKQLQDYYIMTEGDRRAS